MDGAKVGNAAGTGAPVTLTLAGRAGLPNSGIGAVALNVTVVDGENPTVGGGYVTVYPCGTRPDASNLNFTAGSDDPELGDRPRVGGWHGVLLRVRHGTPDRRRVRVLQQLTEHRNRRLHRRNPEPSPGSAGPKGTVSG